MKVIDFFSGCGGTSRGFEDAGFSVMAGLDVDRDACESFEWNLVGAATIRADIRKLPVEAISEYVGSRDRPILFSGCAPCQPFSKQNRAQNSTDPRRTLLAEFGRFVDAWLPDYVFVENVPGMQRIRSDDGPLAHFKATLESLGYHFVQAVVRALDFGVPQTRERLILLGSRKPGIGLPLATHGKGRLGVATVRDWIGGLPALEAGATDLLDREHAAARLSEVNLARIRATPEGGGRESWPDDLKLDCHKGHTGHSDVYGRLAWDKPASGLTTRCISYSNGRFGHPEQDRAISLREAACLQTFPRSYRFSGGLASKAKQIGNAVPPLMAKAVGKTFADHWRQSN